MKKLIYPLMITIFLGSSAFKVVHNATLWKVKEDAYSVKFTSNKFDGTFSGLKTELLFDENNLAASKMIATIDANTINTGNGMRNGHAKKGLDTKNFTTVKFVSTSIEKATNGYAVIGNLTIKDVSKQIKIPFTFTKTPDGGIFAGSFSVKPAEYKVNKSGTPEQLDFQLQVPVTK
ncbi:MAG: YceI family protein [Bacteroidia bacterium]|jgi:polyisoprenoid-binding protein YceI|nr:YceI family protein [Bacteroidia bacterium]